MHKSFDQSGISRREFLKASAAFSAVASFGGRSLQAAGSLSEAVTPTEPIQLFNGRDFSGLYTWVKDTGYDDPEKVFTVQNGVIHVKGRPMGYVATQQAYQNYHLITEFKWGEKTYGSKTVRNSGVLLHANGPDGNRNPWMSSLECQLAQGCVGDFIVIRGKDSEGVTIPVNITSETVLGPDNRTRWKKGGNPTPYAGKQFWWSRHDPEYEELIDTRGRWDVESPVGEWTKVECVADGSRVTVSVNGTVVNECYDVFPASGKILLQSEGFEILFRRFELLPL
ncbi:MAG: 3-keto-disaccharide hydrolase [bacterium]